MGSIYRDVILATPGLVAYWRLGEASGNPQDSAGTNHVTTVAGTPTYSVAGALVGDSNTAITFDGTTTEGLSVPDATALDLGNAPFTIEMWVKRAGAARNDTALHKGTNAYGVGFDATDNFWKLSKTGVGRISRANTAITDGIWHHVVVTRSATGAGGTLIYVDGVEGHTDDVSIDAALVDTAAVLEIGLETGWTGFLGTLDEIAIYNSVLTAAQVSAHYRAGTQGILTGLWAPGEPTDLIASA